MNDIKYGAIIAIFMAAFFVLMMGWLVI